MFYPAHLNLQNRRCLVVGAGTVAERKVLSLLHSGGDVTLISPEATVQIKELAQAEQIQWHGRQFHLGDTEGMFLVCAATDDSGINTQVFKEASQVHGIKLVNVVDVIPECTFAAASVVRHGDLMLSISTSGKSPAMSRRIREYLEAKFETTSLYADPGNIDFTPPPRGQGLPYPVYFLLEDRRCVVISDSDNMDDAFAQRVDLLQRSGASVEQIDSTVLNLINRLSDAFLVLVDDTDFYPGTALADVLCQMPLIEYVGVPEIGTFATPHLVMDGDLIISVSTDYVQKNSDAEKEDDKIKHVQIELARQFENNGHGKFIDFLGSLRPLVIRAIPTQKGRQRFFDDLIDQVPGNRTQKCCLGFEKKDCSIECAFNLIRNGQFECVYQWANEQIST